MRATSPVRGLSGAGSRSGRAGLEARRRLAEPARPPRGARDMATNRSVIVSAVRTPVGRFAGGFTGLRAVDLGAAAIRETVARSGVDPARIDYVLMGHVLQAGAGQITARQAAV